MEKKIYLSVKGITTEIVNVDLFESFNWFNFKQGDKVYYEDVYFADFVSYEKNEKYPDGIIFLEVIY